MQTVITERGQVSIPSDLRRKFHLTPGTGVEWIETKEGIFLIPVPKDPIAAFRGKTKGLTAILTEDRKKERARGK